MNFIRNKLKAIALLATISIVMSLSSCITIRITNPDKYLETDGFISYFSIFPNKAEIKGDIIDYHYFDYQLKDGDEIYLEVTYTRDSFDEEILRLEAVKYFSEKFKYENAVKKDDCILFNYITYISIYNYNGRYEYACVDPNSYRIVYITLDEMSLERISFDEMYLPKTYYIHDLNYADDNIDPYYFDMYEENVECWYG